MKSSFDDLTDRIYNNDREYGPADQIRVAKIIGLAGKNNRVLDVGCYNGFLSKKILDKGNEVFGLDIAKEALKKASLLGIKTKQADLEDKFPFSSGFFDVVVAAEIIEHLKDTDSFLKEIYRVLKPEGYLVLSTSNLVSFGRRIMYLLGKDGYHEASFSYPPKAAGHLRYFNKDLLLGLIKKHNFKISLFTSDTVNFSFNIHSSLRSVKLAEIFPTLGRSLIVKAKK